MKIYLKATIENGNLVVLNSGKVSSHLRQYEGKDLVVSVREYKKKATERQIRWYWGVAIQTIIAGHKKATGEVLDPDEVHAFNMNSIVKPKIRTKEVMGVTIIQVDDFSLSKMNTKEFCVFKDKLQLFWAEKDIIIPDPNQENFLNDDDSKAYKSIEGTL